MVRRIFLFLVVLFSTLTLWAQQTKYYDTLSKVEVDKLRAEYGQSKVYPQEYEQQFLLALSHYPELKDVVIELKYSKERTTMACRPKITSLFSEERTYYILINDKEDFDGILLNDVPFNAQIGVIGHELAHVVDFENKTLTGVVKTGLGYLKENYKRKLEHKIDAMTTAHGLGWQLYEWATYSMFEAPFATQTYKDFKKRIYMSPDQIMELLESDV